MQVYNASPNLEEMYGNLVNMRERYIFRCFHSMSMKLCRHISFIKTLSHAKLQVPTINRSRDTKITEIIRLCMENLRTLTHAQYLDFYCNVSILKDKPILH